MAQPQLKVVTDRTCIDPSVVHRMLSGTYWAQDRTPEQTKLCITHSTPFAVFDSKEQVGFARVVSDRVTVAYLLDVYVVPARRQEGIGTMLTETILKHSHFALVQKWLLRTSDAQSLYARFGFKPVALNEPLMVLER